VQLFIKFLSTPDRDLPNQQSPLAVVRFSEQQRICTPTTQTLGRTRVDYAFRNTTSAVHDRLPTFSKVIDEGSKAELLHRILLFSFFVARLAEEDGDSQQNMKALEVNHEALVEMLNGMKRFAPEEVVGFLLHLRKMRGAGRDMAG
jgi:hypothetical protein